MTKQRLSVLLDDPDVLASELRAVARVVASVLDEPASDATSRVRYGHGVLVRDVLVPYAREIGRGLAQLGLGSFTVDGEAGGLRNASRPRRTGSVKLTDDGLELKVGYKPAKLFPWADVLAIHGHATIPRAGSSEEREALPKRGASSTASLGCRKLVESLHEYESHERVPVTLGIDVLVRGGVLYRVSYDTPGIYANLPDRVDGSVGNYLLLLEALVAAADETTLIPPTTRRLLVRHECTDVLFTKPEELDSFNTWILHALERGIRYGEPEDIDDDVLRDDEDALVVADDGADAEDLDDADLEDEDEISEDEDEISEDEDEDEDREETWGGERTDASSDIAAAEDLDDGDLEEDAIADEDLEAAAKLMDHFRKTRRVNVRDVQEMLAEAQGLEIAEETADADEDVKQAMGFFDASSGSWDVSQVEPGQEGTT